jgi:hypothetical protein
MTFVAGRIRDHLGVNDMTKFTLAASFMAIGLAGGALAAMAADANGDGVLTIDEVQAVMPEVTVESFSTMDLNADGALDAAEVEAAQEAGLIPA